MIKQKICHPQLLLPSFTSVFNMQEFSHFQFMVLIKNGATSRQSRVGESCIWFSLFDCKNESKMTFMQAHIKRAIRQKRKVCVRYHDLVSVCEPYLLAIDNQYNIILYAFQVDGESLSNEKGWRLFNLDLIDQLVGLKEFFVPSHDYSFLKEETVFVLEEVE